MTLIQKSMAAAALAFISTSSLAQVQLQVDDNIKVTAINGQEIRHSLLQPLQKNFTLEAGRHVITARYDRLFNLNNNNHDYLKSDNITITADLQDKQTYQLIMPNQPNSYTSAKEYAKAPSLAISHQGAILVQQNSADERSGVLSGVVGALGGLFGRQNADNAVVANQKAIAAINSQAPSATAQAPKDNLDGFMQIWLNANEEEREKIRQWISK